MEALTILADELRRLKALGVKRVPVSAESLQMLRTAVEQLRASEPAAPSEPVATAPASDAAASQPQRRSPPAAPAKVAVKAEAEPLLPPPPTVVLSGGSKAERLAALRQQMENDPVCIKQLRKGCKLVLGTGSEDARLFFCGEAPGAEEELQGLPFVGPAGQKLTKMIEAMGVSRGQTYIGNIMNWRPALPTSQGQEQIGNRPPTPEEMAYCLPYLRAQLEIVQPEIVVALGATAAKGLLGDKSFSTLQEVRGKWQTYEKWPVVVTYHPSYVLRKEAESELSGKKAKRSVWEDLLMVMERANLPISDKQRRYFI